MPGKKPVVADLVAAEDGKREPARIVESAEVVLPLLEDRHLPAGAREHGGGGRAARSGADHHGVLLHERRARAAALRALAASAGRDPRGEISSGV